MPSQTQAKITYDAIVLFNPTLSEKSVEKLLEQVSQNIKNFGGEIKSVDEPSYKKMSYRIDGNKDAFVVNILFTAPSDAPNLLKRSLNIMDDVVRYMIVRKGKK